MRAFVAVDLDPPAPLLRLAPRLPPHLHVTLRFFAELPDERRPAVLDALRTAAAGEVPFELELRGVGAFPGPRRPRVVWVGFGAGRVELERIAERLADALEERGFPREARAFRPHATLLRVGGPRDAALADRLLGEGREAAFGAQRVERLLLYESRLGAGGAVHEPRGEARLGSPA